MSADLGLLVKQVLEEFGRDGEFYHSGVEDVLAESLKTLIDRGFHEVEAWNLVGGIVGVIRSEYGD